jgi:hypothetical protein
VVHIMHRASSPSFYAASNKFGLESDSRSHNWPQRKLVEDTVKLNDMRNGFLQQACPGQLCVYNIEGHLTLGRGHRERRGHGKSA